jgi:sec-independent protein translocase protein TatA
MNLTLASSGAFGFSFRGFGTDEQQRSRSQRIFVMNKMALGYQELLIILAIVVVLFGASRLPQLAKALGQSKRAFREGQEEAEEEARQEKARQANIAPQQSLLSDVNDEQLFEEARRRAASLRSAEASSQKKD